MLSSASARSLSLWSKEVRMERVVAKVRRHRIYRIAVDPFSKQTLKMCRFTDQ